MYQKERIKRRNGYNISWLWFYPQGGKKKGCSDALRSRWVTELIKNVGGGGKDRLQENQASHRHVVIISRRHTPKDSAQNKPEVLSPKTLTDISLRSHTYSPFHNSCSDLVQRACCSSPAILSLPLQPVTIIFQVSADSSSFFQRGPSNTMNTAPAQAQPQQLGREWKKRNASSWYLRRGTHLMCAHTVTPKLPEQGNASKCPFQLSNHPSIYTVFAYLLTLKSLVILNFILTQVPQYKNIE